MRTKSQTLKYLKNKLQNAVVLDQVAFSWEEWRADPKEIISKLSEKNWLEKNLIVRSSSLDEDAKESSKAGYYDSVLNVTGIEEVSSAIDQVIASFDNSQRPHEIFIQPMLENVKASGVAFTRDPCTNTPYIKINYDDQTGRTDTITSGSTHDAKIFYKHRLCSKKTNTFLDKVIKLCFDLETLLEFSPLDIEFAVDQNDQLYLFQARPLIVSLEATVIDDQEHYQMLRNIQDRLEKWVKPHPYLLGDKGLYGVMPDWNPAEIIGVYPKPLASSLYREVVTNAIWAYQRDNYGYRELRSFPLLVEIEDLPYIDIRVSFNSFVPKSLDSEIAQKLVNYYLKKLHDNPNLHDKVEFEIIYSCYTFNTHKRTQELRDYGFSEIEIDKIQLSLKALTSGIICNKEGLWKKDLDRVKILEQRLDNIINCDLDHYAKIYWLIEDCKRYGTLPFAGLARAGFVAVEFLKSFVTEGILTLDEYDLFMGSLNTVSSSISEDHKKLSKNDFLKKYGHLRPGTYDISSKTYAEAYDTYFSNGKSDETENRHEDFRLTVSQLNNINASLENNGFDIDALELLNFIKGAIEAREHSKFVFTKSISKALDLYKEVCKNLGISEADASFTHIGSILSLNSTTTDPKSVLTASIKRRKRRFELSKQIILPSLIKETDEVFAFFEPPSTPNYITQKSVRGQIALLGNEESFDIEGKIVLIENADPGYDWIFSHNISGLITKFGGANSHMAIRSGELGIPSIIGAASLYEKIKTKQYININCLEKRVEIF